MSVLVKSLNISQFKLESKSLLQLAIPIIISQLAQMGMNFTDTVMAGRHSETSLAGVAIGSSFWVLCFLFLVGLLMSVTPVIAQAWGAGDGKQIKSTAQQGIWLAIICGLPVMLLLQFSSLLFQFIDMDMVTQSQARGYAVAVSFGLPALAMFQVLRGLNDGIHLTRPFMYVSLIGVLANIPLNYIFIYGKLGLPEMGGVGCGWATCIVLWIEFIALLIITLNENKLKPLHWASDWQRPQWQQIANLLKLGLPIGVSLMVEASMFALIALFLAQLGSTVVAGHQVAISMASILFMVPLSLGMALTIRCGYYLGKNQPHMSRYVGKMGLVYVLLIASAYSTLILLYSHQLAGIYTSDPAVQQIAVQLLFFAAIFQFSDGVQVAAAGILRGYKDTRFAFYTVTLAYWIVGLPLGYSLALSPIWGKSYGAPGFWMAFIAGLTIAAILLSARFFYISKRSMATDFRAI